MIARFLEAAGRTPYHPIALALAWVLNAYVAASPGPFAVIRPLVLVPAGALLLLAVGRIGFGGWHAAGLFATGIVGVLLIGRELALATANAARLAWWEILILTAIVILAATAAAFVLRWQYRRGELAMRVGRGINAVATILLALIVVNALARGTLSIEDLREGVPVAAAGNRSELPRFGPDIYLILLDGYPRGDVLREHFDFDNSEFLDALDERGFRISEASHSNYLYTQLTITSLMHMALLDDVDSLGGVLTGASPGQPTARRALNDNPVFDFLRSRGYVTASYAIPYEDPALRKADVLVQLGGLNEFERQLIGTTFLLDLWGSFDRDLSARSLRSQINEGFAQLPTIAANRTLGPRFLFAHVLAPHTPFVFGPNGDPIRSGLPLRHLDRVGPNNLSRARFSDLLVGQVRYVNREALAAIDGVLAGASRPPIILLWSDHGPRSQAISPATASDEDLREAFGILFAAYTPGRADVFPSDVTPSQIMAYLLNAYFNASIPIAGSETFASGGNDPFHLTQVSAPPSPPS